MLPGFPCLLENFSSNIEFLVGGEPKATTKLLESKTVWCIVQRKTHSGTSPKGGEVVMEGCEELECGTLVRVALECREDLHASVPHHRGEVTVEAVAGEETPIDPLCREYIAAGQPVVLLVEVGLEHFLALPRLLPRVVVAARAFRSTARALTEQIAKAHCAEKNS